jgi:Na+-translocating ferredoxin:NAD+ oxidoreductase subunit B
MEISTLAAAVGILGGLGVTFAVFIAVADRAFWVWVDPRLDEVESMLPGTNCGACGEPGCRAFAEALVEGRVQPAACTSMGPAEVEEVADYLGVDAGDADHPVARLLCAGGSHVAAQQAEYRGLDTCAAAAVVARGGKGCPWGCFGLADCEVSCTFDAIRMSRVGLPVVNPDLCTACGDCVEACPQGLFTLMPRDHHLLVQCRNLILGDVAEEMCEVACNGCGRCVQDGAPGLIRMDHGLAVIDYGKIDLAEPAATERCPTGAIVWLSGIQLSTPETGAVASGFRLTTREA